jgi:hypothetical protein
MSHGNDGERDLSEMVAVAAGRPCVVARWVETLRRAGIRPLTADCCAADDHAEVWVRRDEAERARAALRQSGSQSLIW